MGVNGTKTCPFSIRLCLLRQMFISFSLNAVMQLFRGILRPVLHADFIIRQWSIKVLGFYFMSHFVHFVSFSSSFLKRNCYFHYLQMISYSKSLQIVSHFCKTIRPVKVKIIYVVTSMME